MNQNAKASPRSGCRRPAMLLLLTVLVAGCGPTVAPPVVTAPRHPNYLLPTLSAPDPKLAALVRRHEAAWQLFQTGDPALAEREFLALLKQAPQFYPSAAALGYLELGRAQHGAALEQFDRVLQSQGSYVPALVGRGEALLALGREADALATFEAAVKLDPQLTEVGRRVEILRARAAQENVAAAGRAARAGRLEEAAELFEKAIAASPESAFLVRDLADVEAKQGKTDQALARYRKAIELDASDVASRVRVAEILEANGDTEGALAAYTEADTLEPSEELRRRMGALEARLAYLRLPAEYRAIPEAMAITRGELASLVGIRLESLLGGATVKPVVITDERDHWAASWIMATAQAGILEPFDNHTFQPRNVVKRSDLAQAVSRILKIIAAGRPSLLKDWQSRQQKMPDVGVSNLHYADASLAVAAGILPLTEAGLFELSRDVSGAEAIAAIARLESFYRAAQ